MRPQSHKIVLFALFLFVANPLWARVTRADVSKGYSKQEWVVEDGEKVAMIHLLPVQCFARGVDLRRYLRLVNAVKRVYPIAKLAGEKLVSVESELSKMTTKKQQREYVNQIYRELIAEYTPELKRMTQTQGRILVRLIDRETQHTAFGVVKEFRGGFVASFWQGIGRMFGQDLKSEYGTSPEDKLIERIIIYYEAGLL